jgi:gamma-glutamylcyclotransferase (GGCT)/AIG2-like uncharacterized protein YtfP
MNKNSCYAFYGSLRQGMYNHDRFGNLECLFTEKLAGFKLFALERYPIAVATHNPAHIITIEVTRVIHRNTENEIHQLELNAGYYYDEVTVRGITVGIYLFHNSGTYTWVPHGDWVRYWNEKKLSA